jgi:integrase
MAKVLTQLAVDRMKPPNKGRVVAWDALVPGFGLRLTSKGARTWIAMYRVNGKKVLQTLGTMKAIPKVDDARQAAREAIMMARTGVNPVEEKRAEVAAAEAEGVTFAEVADRWMREYVERNCSASLTRERRRIIHYDLLDRWGNRPAREITKSDVNDLLDEKAACRDRSCNGRTGGAGVQSNRTLSLLTALFNWAASKDLVETNPTAGVRRRVKEEERDRYLDDGEIIAFWGACELLGPPWGPIFEVLLLTGQRRSEVSGMRWSELALEKREWTIPSARAKNGKAHIVHLSDMVVEILERLPRLAGCDFVFSTNFRSPVVWCGRPKAELDELMGNPPAWIIHDLRRTATTGLARLGIAPHVADRILNHTAGTIRGVARTYNRFEYLPERKAALEAWERYIESLVRPTPANVVPFVR